MERLVVHPDTGEVLTELREGDRIIKAESIESYKKHKRKSQRSFTKIDTSEGIMILKELSSNERSLLFILQYYVAYESCLIRYPNGKDVSFNDVVDFSGWSRGTTKKCLDGLIEKNIIYKGRNGRNVQYFMNPWVATKGPKINNTLKDMFKHYEIRSLGKMTWEEYEKSLYANR